MYTDSGDRFEPSETFRLPERVFALLLTITLVCVPAVWFSLLFGRSMGDKLACFGLILSGPLAGLWTDRPFFLRDVLWVVPLLLAYPLYPRWYTLLLTLLGAFCWFAGGLVAATGGV
jgi:hypothetical protein